MRNWLKSNSILIGVDIGPAYRGEDKHGLYFLGLNDGFNFSLAAQRNSSSQLGSQQFSSDDISLAPDLEFSLSFIANREFENEDSLGLNFQYHNEFTSILKGKTDYSFNLYLFISDKQGYDLIKQIRDAQSMNGLQCIALGNCFTTQYGLSLRAAELPRSNFSFVASNIEMSIVSGDKLLIPAINLETGEKDGSYSIFLDWSQIEVSLNQITKEEMPILPTTEVKFFQGSLENLDIPSAILSPLRNANIQTLDLTLPIPRETSYGFSSNFPYARKIKFPIKGELSLSSIVSNFNNGSGFSGLMTDESNYSVRLDFLDPQEIFLSGQSFASLSGFLNTGVSGVSGFFTDSRSLLISGAKLNNYAQDFPINNLGTATYNFSFPVYESGGLMAKFGYLSAAEDSLYLNTPDARRLIDSSGDYLTTNKYLTIFGEDCSLNYLIDGSGNLMLADSWVEIDNPCPYDLPPSIFTLQVDSVVDFTISLSWSESIRATSYELYRSPDGFSFSLIATSPVPGTRDFSDVIFTGPGEYFYYVVALGDHGTTQSNTVSATV